MDKPTLIILAGGMSSRMGFDKGFIKYKGKYIIQHLIDKNASYFSEIMISSSNKNHKVFKQKMVPDKISQIGPIGGVFSCLHESKSELNVVISCDSPLIQLKIIKKILFHSVNSDADLIYSTYKNKRHPLPGCFNKKILSKLNDIIDDGERKLLSLEKYFKTDFVDFSDEKKDFFLNLNSPNDLKKIK